jgi:aerobic carbon-monoxide dehydrogenase small subunit
VTALRLVVEGRRHQLDEALGGESLLRVLRDELGVVGVKDACEQGECGSCTVTIDGELACACLVPAAQARDAAIETVAAVAGEDGPLHPVQAALVDLGAVQCGFCTPGIVMAARDLLARVPDPGDADIREGLAGNLCRCTGYAKIVEAVGRAAGELRR